MESFKWKVLWNDSMYLGLQGISTHLDNSSWSSFMLKFQRRLHNTVSVLSKIYWTNISGDIKEKNFISVYIDLNFGKWPYVQINQYR